MGEKEDKLRTVLHNAKEVISANVRKNVVNIMITIYMIIYVIWNMAGLLLTGDISQALFWTLIIQGINVPVVIMMSLILTGKWKSTERTSQMDLKLAKKQYELDLKDQEIRHLTEIRTNYKDLEDARKNLMFERTLSEHKLRILSLQWNIGWEEANNGLKELDKEIKESVENRESVGITTTPKVE